MNQKVGSQVEGQFSPRADVALPAPRRDLPPSDWCCGTWYARFVPQDSGKCPQGLPMGERVTEVEKRMPLVIEPIGFELAHRKG